MKSSNLPNYPGDRFAYWFVDNLPPDRPTRCGCGRKRWLKLVNAEIERDKQGNLIHRESTLAGAVVMRVTGDDTAAWKAFLRRMIFSYAYRMFWEPKAPRESRGPKVDLFA